ncbi:MAG: YIP1 family protein [Chloroflexota bacterium]
MTTPSSSPARRFDLPRVFAVMFRPRAAFSEMASETRAVWSTPMILLTITAALVVLVRGYLRTRAAMMGEIELPPDWQWWTPEMQNSYMQAQQVQQGPVYMYIMPLVGALAGLWLGWLALAALLHLGSTLFGGRGSMQGALNVVGWASLPFALRDLLRAAYMLLAQHTIASPSLSGFASGGGFLYHLLARTDLFLFWSFILLIIGFAVVDNLPRGKAFANAFIVMALALLAQAGLAVLASSIGGAAIQRPFF